MPLSQRAHAEQTYGKWQNDMAGYFESHGHDLEYERSLLQARFMRENNLVLLNGESFSDMMLRIGWAEQKDRSRRKNR